MCVSVIIHSNGIFCKVLAPAVSKKSVCDRFTVVFFLDLISSVKLYPVMLVLVSSSKCNALIFKSKMQFIFKAAFLMFA